MPQANRPTDRHSHTHRQTDTVTHTDRQTQSHTETDRHSHTHRQTDTVTHTDRQTQSHTQIDRHSHTHRESDYIKGYICCVYVATYVAGSLKVYPQRHTTQAFMAYRTNNQLTLHQVGYRHKHTQERE